MGIADQAIERAIVVSGSALDANQASTRLALYNEAGDPIDLGTLDTDNQTGAEVVLTGFTTQAAAAVAATDTVNQAIAKLQARIVALEA